MYMYMSKYVSMCKIKVNSSSKECFEASFTLIKVGKCCSIRNVYLYNALPMRFSQTVH